MNNPRTKLNHIALSQAITDSQADFLLRLELFAVVATEIKAKYDALVNAGFTQDQALELCKARVM